MGAPNSRVVARSLVFAGIAALAACSGGPSLGVPATTAGQSAAHATQSIAHDVSPNPYPTAIGAKWTYNYLLVLANSPGTVQNTSGTITTTLASATTFNGFPVLDYNSVFTYSSPANGGITGTATTDEYDNFVGSFYYLYGHVISGVESAPAYSNTSSNTQTYGSPFILDILPEKNTNKATEPGAYTLTASSTSTANGGTNVSETYARNNDGSSTTNETITLAGTPYTYAEAINADFSATQTNGLPGQSNSGSTTFSAPSSDVVNVVYTPVTGSPVTTNVPVWWGTTPLLSDTFKQLAAAEAVPARCHSSYTGQPAVHLRESLSYVEPVQGSTDVETIERYVLSGTGVVCITNTRLVSYYANLTTGALSGTTSISVLQGLTAFAPLGPRDQHDIVGFGPQAGGSGRPPLPIGVTLEKFSGKR